MPRLSPDNLQSKEHPLRKLGYKIDRPPVSSSSLGDFYTCERKFFWRYRLGLVKKHALPAKALFVGEVMHDAIRSFALGGTPDTVLTGAARRGQKKLDEITDSEGSLPLGATEFIQQCISLALGMAVSFRRLLLERKEGVLSPEKDKVLHVEREVQVALPEKFLAERVRAPQKHDTTIPLAAVGRVPLRKHMVLAGTIDAVTQNLLTLALTLHDYKSTSHSPLARAKTCRFEPQVIIYRILADSIGVKATAFWHYILKKPTIRHTKKETLDEYIARQFQWYKDKAAETPNDPPVVVSKVNLTHLPLYPKPFIRMVRRVHAASRIRPAHAKEFPQTGAPRACHDSYGQECPFLSLCTSDPVTWADKILLGFKQVFRYGGPH